MELPVSPARPLAVPAAVMPPTPAASPCGGSRGFSGCRSHVSLRARPVESTRSPPPLVAPRPPRWRWANTGLAGPSPAGAAESRPRASPHPYRPFLTWPRTQPPDLRPCSGSASGGKASGVLRGFAGTAGHAGRRLRVRPARRCAALLC